MVNYLASENGVLAKLAGLRQTFLSGVEEARAQFAGRIRTLREEYLNQVVDATLGDPKLSDVERALSSWGPQVKVVAVPTHPLVPIPPEVSAATAATLAPPDKQPLKSYRVSVYGHCPACNAPLFEAQAKYCSQCAYPLEEV